jgi:hypothetical protein
MDGDGNPELGFHRVLGSADKCLDAQMLADPFEKTVRLATASGTTR